MLQQRQSPSETAKMFLILTNLRRMYTVVAPRGYGNIRICKTSIRHCVLAVKQFVG